MEPVHVRRRQMLAATVLGAAALHSARSNSALGQSSPSSSFDSLRRIKAGDLEVAYAEAGPTSGVPVLLLHGWPYDIHTYVDVAPRLSAAGYRVIVPYLRGYGATRFLSDSTPRNGQQAALAADALALMEVLRLERPIVAGCDWGARTACILAALWPERCRALVSVSGYLIGSQELNRAPLPPQAELQWWYQYYFVTERGEAGYRKYTNEFARLIWQVASPKWQFSDVTFQRSAEALENPDHVAVAIHNYRWRLGLAPGEARFDDLEQRLASFPAIATPTITLEGDANGAPHPDPATYAPRFTGRYQHRLIAGGVGHNLPQEAPDAFAQAVMDVAAS
ncbi:alpha/beta fold hydrolase [Reyranella sp.]|uniref:alpha/beta fold hydrolase n=1 Tax=Reyranella sp. TaxID=1929291 RepID=UPI003D151744